MNLAKKKESCSHGPAGRPDSETAHRAVATAPRTKWKITISRDALFGNWSFAYNGKLTTWQIICITLAGWKIERIES